MSLSPQHQYDWELVWNMDSWAPSQICRIRNSRGGGRNLFVNTPSGGFWYKLDLRIINWFQGLLALTYLWYSQVLPLFVLLTCLWLKWALRTYCLDDFSSVLIGLSALHLTPTDAFLIQGLECIKYIWPCYFPDWNGSGFPLFPSGSRRTFHNTKAHALPQWTGQKQEPPPVPTDGV